MEGERKKREGKRGEERGGEELRGPYVEGSTTWFPVSRGWKLWGGEASWNVYRVF